MTTKNLPLDGAELEALSKTVGIAIQNLSMKTRKHEGTTHGREASDERNVLIGVQQKMLELQRE